MLSLPVDYRAKPTKRKRSCIMSPSSERTLPLSSDWKSKQRAMIRVDELAPGDVILNGLTPAAVLRVEVEGEWVRIECQLLDEDLDQELYELVERPSDPVVIAVEKHPSLPAKRQS